jgi:tape measure domain-containing protein
MADKISVSYDANIDDMKRKLDELIAKNRDLSAAAAAAARAISNIASAQGLSTINNINNSFNTTVNVLAQVNTNLTQVNAQLNNTTNSFNRMGQQVNSVKQSITVFDSLLKRVAARVAAYFAIDSVVGFAKSIVDVERKMEILQNRINFVFDSATGGTLAFNRLREMSIRLGIEFTSLAEGFASFGIAAKMAGFSASESEGMFSKVAVALRASGASSIQTQRSFYALQQMLSKGVVAAEELRRQLGEALPGASDLMTKAYNRLHPAQELTNRQFTKLLEDGKIISAEILPEFANVVEEVFAPALSGKQNSLDASINRVTTQLDRFKLALANFLPTKAVANTLSDFFGSLNTMMEAGFKDFVRLGALAASGNFAAFDSELAKLEIVRAAETAKAEREQKDIENRIKQRAELYAKQGVSAEKAISGETDRITEQRKELEELNKELERREIALKKARTANVGQPGTAGMRGMADVVGAKEALKQQKELVKQKEREIEFTQGLITAIGQLSQKREEEQEKVSADTKKAEIAAAKELLAAEETRLVATTEGTTAYYNQLVKVIEARKNLAKIEQRDTPQAMGLSLAKLDKDLEKARKMIGSFDPNVAEVIEEGVYVPSVDALQKLDKEIRKQREDELELAIVTAKNLVETTEEGTQARANAEEWLALQVSELEKFKVRISTDSEELKAAKIALINEELKNQLKNINKEIVDDSVASNEKIVELIQKANDLIEKTQLDTYRRRRAIVKQQFEAMANDIKEAMSQTGDFEALAQLAKALSGVEQAGKKAISSLDLNQVGEVIDDIGGLYSAVAGYQSTLLNNEAILLKEQLDQKLISEEEYNRKSLELEKKRFEQEKKVATLEATINAASGIVKAIAQQKYWQAALITATLAAQIAAIQSQQFPGFKDGVIDINGPGTGTSDSIPARLSRGESVMTADETKRYKPVLQAIRDNNFEEFVSKRYIDAMGSQNVSSAVGNSFAENLTNSFDLQTAELAHLLKQNRKVAIKNVDELAKAMSRRNTTEKVINRRRFK